MCYPGIHVWSRDAMALIEKQEEKVHVFETNLIRRIVGIKKYHKRKTDELREEQLARNNLAWAGHGVRMGDEKLAKTADIQKVEGKGGERGPKL